MTQGTFFHITTAPLKVGESTTVRYVVSPTQTGTVKRLILGPSGWHVQAIYFENGGISTPQMADTLRLDPDSLLKVFASNAVTYPPPLDPIKVGTVIRLAVTRVKMDRPLKLTWKQQIIQIASTLLHMTPPTFEPSPEEFQATFVL